jgi:NAD(P)-dependent dehydrogenase (short-subunit alcohol dehydrogenase family)
VIKKATNTSVAECWIVDLADFKSISAFADRFENEGGGRLDILVENAALATKKFETTKDGWEAV